MKNSGRLKNESFENAYLPCCTRTASVLMLGCLLIRRSTWPTFFSASLTGASWGQATLTYMFDQLVPLDQACILGLCVYVCALCSRYQLDQIAQLLSERTVGK
ncbi:putative parathyroid hormone 2 receptor [Trichinella spiralis]|uniref:putative parathyroid hormone 2 receptor n=1 Tax=Trichinella spiralis TaxID=6334 RepID=UPI0001EFBA46|nr:putative parathyroid hormone 2 receptor [Trichinella spiralis]